MTLEIPETQWALELIGPDQVRLNQAKPVPRPGPQQLLCRVEAAGLCFSDLKLMKQFAAHPRKSGIVSGLSEEVLREIPSYVPGQLPAIPGHEAVVRVWAVGPGVQRYAPGQRFLVQTDYRWLRTEAANAAFGYNFEGALEEYVLMDERVITSPDGESMLIPASDNLSASAVALVEPWACVEDAYAEKQRRSIRAGGRMLVVAENEAAGKGVAELLSQAEPPAALTWLGENQPPRVPGLAMHLADSLAALAHDSYDDIAYFGSSPETVEALLPRLAARGILNIVLCGSRLGREVACPVGRVHYGGIRIIGTTGTSARDAMTQIPESAEVVSGASLQVVGAGGPMGVMHVVRALCAGTPRVTVYAADTDAARLGALSRVAAPLARKHHLDFVSYDPREGSPQSEFNYIALMAPVPALVTGAVESGAQGAIINIFAGIPADVIAMLDLDRYLEKGLYFVGTSGSVLEDMRVVLAKVEAGQLDTNLSVAAISGMEGAVEGLRAVERRTVTGKIVVYPWCRGLGLLELKDLGSALPEVGEALENGLWNQRAEQLLARRCGYARPVP